MIRPTLVFCVTVVVVASSYAQERTRAVPGKTVQSAEKAPATDASMPGGPTKTIPANPIRWKTFPQTSRENPLELEFCQPTVIRVSTTGGWGETNLVDLAAGEKWPNSDHYSISNYQWASNRVSMGSGNDYLNPSPSITSPDTPAADAAFDVRRNRSKMPSIMTGFGQKSFTRTSDGQLTLFMRDSQGQSRSGTIHVRWSLHDNFARIDRPRIVPLQVSKNQPSHRVSFSARYNGCSGNQIDETIISARLIDPQGQQVESRGSGMRYDVRAMPGQYTVTIIDNGQQLSPPYAFRIL